MESPSRGLGRRITVVALVASLAAGVLALVGSPEPAAAAAAPTPTPARTGRPHSLVSLGDSLSRGTGTGPLARETPANSWVVGTNPAVNSLRQRLGIDPSNTFGLATNGQRMTHMASQVLNGKADGLAGPMPTNAQYVILEMGGNDLCRDSVASMTSVADYRSQFVAGLNAIKQRNPEALIQIMSVPDIYMLWYIRGAPNPPNPYTSDQADTARLYWDAAFGSSPTDGLFPCQSLLNDPTDMSAAAVARRDAVRTRNIAYNQVLSEECAKVLRCRFDDNTLFDVTSNRNDPPYGDIRPHDQWWFTDQDISRNTRSGCPLTGILDAGCGDHFHPSIPGQTKVAALAQAVTYQWDTDSQAPTATATPNVLPRSDGHYPTGVKVTFGGTDNVGLKGQEVRLHKSDGTVTPWDPSFGVHAPMTFNEEGLTYVEVRSLDVNGNQSASTILALPVLPSLPGQPSITTALPSDSSVFSIWLPPVDAGGRPVTSYVLKTYTDGLVESTIETNSTWNSYDVPVVNGRVYRLRVQARNELGLSNASDASSAFLPPFKQVSDFVTRSYTDYLGRAPTGGELLTTTGALQQYQQHTGDVVATLEHSTEWDRTVGSVSRLYLAYFLRAPEDGGLKYWIDLYRRGIVTLQGISDYFAQSAEFIGRYGTLSTAAFIDRVYQNVLGRTPDTEGRNYWLQRTAAGVTRGGVMLFFSDSPEYTSVSRNQVDTVSSYLGLLGRAPTDGELSAALGQLKSGSNLAALNQQLMAQSAYAKRVVG